MMGRQAPPIPQKRRTVIRTRPWGDVYTVRRSAARVNGDGSRGRVCEKSATNASTGTAAVPAARRHQDARSGPANRAPAHIAAGTAAVPVSDRHPQTIHRPWLTRGALRHSGIRPATAVAWQTHTDCGRVWSAAPLLPTPGLTPQCPWCAMRHMRTGPRPASLYGLDPDRLRPVPVQPAAAGPGPAGQSQARSAAFRYFEAHPTTVYPTKAADSMPAAQAPGWSFRSMAGAYALTRG